MRKIFTFLFAALMSVGMWAQNPSGSCGANLSWEFNPANGTLTITGTGVMDNYDGEVTYAPWVSYYESITSVIISNGVTSIGQLAFFNCSSLASIEIPNSVTSIGPGAFYYASGLETVTINATTPPTLGIYAFEGTAAALTIYVPAASVTDYKGAWTAYADKIVAAAEPEPAKERVIFGVNVPANGKPESIELVGSFMEDGWNNGIVLTVSETGWYVSFDVYANADDEFKIRAAGSWNNEIFVRTETGWTATQNSKFGDVWVDDTYKGDPVKWVDLDLSGDNYGWKTAVQSIENIELTEQAKKVVVDGVIYIVRDGKIYNAQGAQVK